MSLRFDDANMLFLLLLSLPIIWLGWRHLQMRPLRKVTAVIARLIVLTLLSMMLAGASVERETSRMTVIALVDVSGSVRDFVRLPEVPEEGYGQSNVEYLRWWFRRAAEQRGPDDRFGLIAFDGTTYAVATPTSSDYTDDQLDVRLVDGTNIEEALRLALALFPPDTSKRIVLATDGNETSGDAIAAALEAAGGSVQLAGAGQADQFTEVATVPIDVLPLPYRVEREVIVESVDAPPTAASQSTITLRVTLNSTEETTGILQVSAEGSPLDLNATGPGTGRRVRLKPGRNVELVTLPLTGDVIHRFEAFSQPTDDSADTLAGNNSGEAVTVTPGQGSVLIVDNTETPSGVQLESTLRRLSIDSQRIKASLLPLDLLSLQAFDLIILNNVPSEQIPRAGHELLAEYVRHLGGGLIMVGGIDSFGAGGWNGTAVEEILPVRLDLPEQLVIPSAAVAFVLDNSGSMARGVFGAEQSQQEIANEGAALALETLDKADLVTVITFNSITTNVVPLAKNNDPAESVERVRSIASGGGTHMYPALELAYRQLAAADAQVKHVIVLSDGKSTNVPFIDLVRQMKEEGITVSTITVGDDADDMLMQNIADYGGGKYYRVRQATMLPRIFVKEVRVVRKPMIREGAFTPVLLPSGSPITMGLTSLPELTGLVLTQPKDDEDITLAIVDPENMPLLAHWNVELGRVAAFTSSADRSWANRWIRSSSFDRIWSSLARVIARPATSRDSELSAEIVNNDLRIRLDAADREGKPLDLLTVPGSVYTPSGERIELTLDQTGPGTYEAVAPALEAGNYVIALTPRQGAARLAPVVGGANRTTGPEYNALQSDAGMLRSIAEATGGRLLDLYDPYTADLFDKSLQRPIRARQPIWISLLIWCLGLLLLDVATRRLAWDRYVSKAAAVEFARQAAESVKSRGEGAAQSLGTLRTRTTAVEQQRETLSEGAEKLRGDGGMMKPVRLRREELERQQAARPSAKDVRTALDELQSRPQGEKKKPSAKSDEEDAADESAATTSGLLAAKRRAQRRYENPNDEQD